MTPRRLYNGVRLVNQPCLRNVERLDMGAVPMISTMMQTGIQVDLSHFARMETELVQDMERVTEEVRSLSGHYINLGSGDQVADLLFKKMGLKQARYKLTKGGTRESVEDEVLTAIQHAHPVVPRIQDYKEYEKLLGTYVRPMPKLARRTEFGAWRMFPNLGHTRVPAGRLNCKDPNLLAMPTRTSRGRDIRKGFITREGWVLLSVDESQIEPRIATFRSGDEGLINVYQNDEDLYSDFATAAFRLGDERHCGEDGKWIYPTVDTWEHRRPSKICILAAIYDVTPEGLLGQMPVICRTCNKKATEHTCGRFVPLWDEQGCARLLTAFYLKYPAILEMRKADHRRARQYGYIWDMWGRILHVAAVYSVHPWVVSKALREAGNFPMQSGAQGTIKLTMAEVHDDWTANRMADVAHPLLQIHDELLYECRQDVAEEWGEHIRSRFSGCCSLGDIAIKTGMATADTWGDLEK